MPASRNCPLTRARKLVASSFSRLSLQACCFGVVVVEVVEVVVERARANNATASKRSGSQKCRMTTRTRKMMTLSFSSITLLKFPRWARLQRMVKRATSLHPRRAMRHERQMQFGLQKRLLGATPPPPAPPTFHTPQQALPRLVGTASINTWLNK